MAPSILEDVQRHILMQGAARVNLQKSRERRCSKDRVVRKLIETTLPLDTLLVDLISQFCDALSKFRTLCHCLGLRFGPAMYHA